MGLAVSALTSDNHSISERETDDADMKASLQTTARRSTRLMSVTFQLSSSVPVYPQPYIQISRLPDDTNL